ncbi:unnamed protein product [Prunus armeniaca]|uniref:Pectinesterase inhibitor domain-containing protein n=1 Tax=Prunus armeniaca TaxID=36596 RepID=A0A6J5VNE3_PRUAR|nr:unnamed protein product [Prunus armeniaca]
MDSQLSYVLFFAFFLLFLSSSPAPADARASPLLRSVCKQTRDSFHQNYTECVKTLSSDARIRSSASNDLKVVAINVLEIAAETATDTQELFNSYLQMETGTKAIQQCAQSYGSVASAFQGTLDGVKEEDDMVNYTAARIVDSIVVCEKALSSDGVELPQTISNRVHLVRLYKDIGCTVTSQLVSIWLRARKH